MTAEGLDPPWERDAHRTWELTATRPFTQAPIGAGSAGRRQRCAVLSKLWTPERNLRMICRPDGTTLGSVKR